jgi:hypothetical protein
VSHEEEESRVGQAGPTRRPRPSGEGESRPVGKEGRWPRLGRKPELGQSSRNKIILNFFWNLDFCKVWKFLQGDLDGILTWGFFLKSHRFSRNLRKMPNDMP